MIPPFLLCIDDNIFCKFNTKKPRDRKYEVNFLEAF